MAEVYVDGPKRGEIYMADPGPTVGHEQRGRRPHLVLSIGRMNSSRLKMVIGVPLTSTDASSLLHVRIDPEPYTGLSRVSYAMPEMIRSLPIVRLERRLGRVPAPVVERTAQRTGLLLGLGRTKF